MDVDSSKGLIGPIENYDPLAKFLRGRLKLTPVSFFFVVFFLNMIVDLWLGFHYNLWFSSDKATPGLLQDISALATDYFFNPMMAALYIWSPGGATQMFHKLQQSGVFPDAETIKERVDNNRRFYESRIVFYVITFLSLLLALAQIAAYQNWVPWESIGGFIYLEPEAAFYRSPFWLLSFYTMFFALYDAVVTIIILRRLFKVKGLRIVPLHPDRCGGVVSISQYTARIAYGIASAGAVMSGATILALQTSTLGQTYPVIVGDVLYLLAAPVLFFWPVGTAHTAMKDAKNAELLKLAQRFDTIYARTNDAAKDDLHIEEDLKKLENVKKLYAIVREFPVWPFDMSTVQNFFAVVTVPLLPGLISIAVELFKVSTTTP